MKLRIETFIKAIDAVAAIIDYYLLLHQCWIHSSGFSFTLIVEFADCQRKLFEFAKVLIIITNWLDFRKELSQDQGVEESADE